MGLWEIATSTTQGASVVLQTDADADIRSGDLENESYNRSGMPVGNETLSIMPGSSSTRNYKAYLRFALPSNIDTVTSATFTISRADAGAWNFLIIGYGLNDNTPGEVDWFESNTGGITWNSAPGNDATSPSVFDVNSSTPIGSFTTTGYNNGGASGDSYTIASTSEIAPELVDFINADTNGYITIMLGRHESGLSSSVDQFKARTGEGPAYMDIPAPTLTLEYTASPGIAGDFDFDADVDGADFLAWQRGESPAPLSATDLADWKSNYGGNGIAAAAAVPEPSPAVLIAIASAGIAGLRCIRRI